ncbi:TPA: LysR family transcriptional regulator [Klebsiella pneumoniae]|uniref:LysR family transcriptional regulator n=1 Tax=Klebsiella TaxID=570 RepID=UPI001037325E|nr:MULTISPECIES: LysR family transcriptional regulator [Klebsiella]MDU5243920.1 LysR family transcriptional regulator [Klebsiella pneumoniae]QBI37344.1 LysR family transcriptional regulator [Klebsiella pneumoniae]TYY04930.1 LysR family transcriptional regulator [Klebsiella pneumoniae]HBW7861770.1 LysR family transcriptional regulator [Klebsiella pneumoniae]HBZ2636436.1 LysR family transcriptional regulator [Klebsiella pneumoniae]
MELLNHMSYFVEVVKAKSFRGAAEALGMPNSTLSRKIGELEKTIGLRLLHRTTRKIELTEAGQIYYDRCRRIVDEARLAHEQLGTMLANPEGLLRISLPADLAIVVLSPIICQFSERYPGISFDFDLTPRNVDLVSEPFDLAIRMGVLPDSGLIARKLGSLPRYLYASPQYLATKGVPATPEELSEHECLVMRPEKTTTWHLHNDEERVSIKASGRFQMNSIGMMRRLAAMGMGVAMLPELIVEEDIKRDALIRVLAPFEADAVTIYALTETRLLPAKVQVFIEFIREHLK